MPKKLKNSASKKSSNGTPSSKHERSSLTEESDVVEVWQDWSSNVHLCLVVGTFLLALYVQTLHPSIPGGDSGELIISAHELGVAHPPGYPTFTILAKLTMTWLPFGAPAWKVNLLNGVFSAAAGALLQLTVLRVTGCMASSILSVSMFSLSRLTWTWSCTAEVFGLNNFFLALIMLLAVLFESSENRKHVIKYARIGTFVCGLSLTNQHTAVIYVACVAIWVLVKLKKLQVLSTRLLVEMGVLFMAGLSPYLYLPFSSQLHQARWTWGDQSSLTGLLTHILRSEYGTFQLGKDQTGLGLSHGLISYWDHLMDEYRVPLIILILAGLFLALKWKLNGESSVAMVFVVMATVYIVFFAWRANLDISDPLLKGVVERFWMQSDIVLCFLGGVGFFYTTRQLCSVLFASNPSFRMVLTFVGSAVVLASQLRNYSDCDQSGNHVVRDFARSLIDSMPPNAVVFTKGDLPTNSMRYLHLCENMRPDVHLIDVEVLSYEWSLPMLRKFYPRVTFPGDYWHLTDGKHEDGRISFTFKSLLDANQRWPMFACIGMQNKDPSWQAAYTAWPYGVCHKIVPASEELNPQSWGQITQDLADNWKYGHKGFEVTSWEKVANDEMWNAKISTAFFMFQEAEKAKDSRIKTQLYHESYELYFRAIKNNQVTTRRNAHDVFPVFWHKNFALACERLLRFDVPMDKTRLCKLAINHFGLYVAGAPDDPDKPNIQEAIQTLKQKLLMYEQFEEADKTLDRVVERAERTSKRMRQA